MDGTDMFRMMQQAMELSKAFGGGNSPDSGNGFERVVNMLRLFNSEQMDLEQPRHDNQRFTDDARSQALNSIKAAIPYIDHRYQRYIGVFVKLIEIQMMMEIYRKSAEAMCNESNGDWRRIMLESLRPHLDNGRMGMIDFMIAVMDLNEAACRMQRTISATDLI